MYIETRLQQLEKRNKEFETEIITLNSQNKQLQNEIEKIKEHLQQLSIKRNELYYQRFLERLLSASHCKTSFGVTDITTENEHIEIKHWRNYKAALGQLLSYNFNDDKNLCAYFFGYIEQTNENK
jgi:chromosome segregation ATPase